MIATVTLAGPTILCRCLQSFIKIQEAGWVPEIVSTYWQGDKFLPMSGYHIPVM